MAWTQLIKSALEIDFYFLGVVGNTSNLNYWGWGRRIVSSRSPWATHWDSVLKKGRKERKRKRGRGRGREGKRERVRNGWGWAGRQGPWLSAKATWPTAILDKLIFSVKQINKQNPHASQHFHQKLIYWDIYAKTVNANYMMCCQSGFQYWLGERKGCSHWWGEAVWTNIRTLWGLRPGRSFSVQTFTQAASDNWVS